MTNKNISALTAATTPLAGTEIVPVVSKRNPKTSYAESGISRDSYGYFNREP